MMKIAALLVAFPALASSKAVRKDWAVLSQEEKDTFARGMNLLKDNGTYDDIVKIHQDSFETPTPFGDEAADILIRNAESKGPSFLPFHRQQVLLMELAMQGILGDPFWGMPYWNYVADAEGNNPDPKSNPMWGPNEIGSDGRQEDGVVVDGPFAYWPIKYTAARPFDDPRPQEVYLERTLGRVTEFPSLVGDLESAFNQTAYDGDDLDSVASVGIRNWIQGSYGDRGPLSLFNPNLPMCSLHCQAHGFVGASMLIGSSPNDPVFYLLHAFTDALWYQWQDAQVRANPNTDYFDYYTPKNNGPFRHNLDDQMGGWEVTPRSVLDTRDLPYEYEGLPTAHLDH